MQIIFLIIHKQYFLHFKVFFVIYYIVIQLDKYYGPESNNPKIVQPIYYPGLGTPVVKQKGDLCGKY